jgi:NAD(P)-dependent dehydrogenase (short-subunit alcohol dehydrogenase family)
MRHRREMLRLSGKHAIITGAASGIGEASAHLFAAHGASVTIADISDKGQDVAERIKGAGGAAIFVRTDVSSAEQMQRLFDAHLEEYRTLDILFNNASRTSSGKPIEQTTEAEFDETLAIDFKSVFLACRLAASIMGRCGSGSIINTSAGSAREGLAWPNLCAYIGAKGAVISFTRALAVELSPRGIRVNSLNPGLVDTPMMRGFCDLQPDPDEFWENLSQLNLVRRMAQPIELANAALFLASEESSYVTGTDMLVDGGLVLG